MSAIPYVTLNDLVDNIRFQLEVSVDLSELSDEIFAYQLTHESLLALELTDIQLNAVLKAFTGCVSALAADVNCYPVGAIDTACFDTDGNPL